MKPFASRRTALLFFIIFLEGYVVLATELLAIRLLIPFVGSGIEVVAIIISAVLLPLAIGYHQGGHLLHRHQAHRQAGKKRLSIRAVLVQNLFTALFILTLGLSYYFQEMFFFLAEAFGLHSTIAKTLAYCLLFIVYPVFLLAQTVPLISNYFAKRELSKMTGMMLCFSTTGSFFGSVFTTIVLMMTIGVNNTVILVLGGIALMICLLDRRFFSFIPIASIIVFGMGVSINHSGTLRGAHVVSNNAYNLVQVYSDTKGRKIFSANHSTSSAYMPGNNKAFEYIEYLNRTIIAPIKGQRKKILVIGAGGFTLGLEDKTNLYTFIDIDPDLKKVAEEHFLPEALGKNKVFIPASARAYLAATHDQFDFILIDAFTNRISIPMECTTAEFFQSVKGHVKRGGIVAANIIARPDFSDPFSLRIHRTFTAVFPLSSRQIIQNYNAWTGQQVLKGKKKPAGSAAYYTNIIYTYYDRADVDDKTIYTDDKNTYSLDKAF